MSDLITVAVFAFGCGLVIGWINEWRIHREYCDCQRCERWRKRIAAKAVKKTSEEA